MQQQFWHPNFKKSNINNIYVETWKPKFHVTENDDLYVFSPNLHRQNSPIRITCGKMLNIPTPDAKKVQTPLQTRPHLPQVSCQ